MTLSFSVFIEEMAPDSYIWGVEYSNSSVYKYTRSLLLMDAFDFSYSVKCKAVKMKLQTVTIQY